MIEITSSDLRKKGVTKEKSFDASENKEGILFLLDANQNDKFSISNFSEKDQIKFLNTPTSKDGDLKFWTRDYNKGETLISVKDLDVKLTNLKSSFIWDSKSFKKIFGNDSIILG